MRAGSSFYYSSGFVVRDRRISRLFSSCWALSFKSLRGSFILSRVMFACVSLRFQLFELVFNSR